MEPDNTYLGPQNDAPTPPPENGGGSAVPNDPSSTDDLRAEGIDIVGTSMAFDNEFSKPETERARGTPLEQDRADDIPSPYPRQSPQESERPKPLAAASIPVPPPRPPVSMPISTVAPGKDDPSIHSIRTFKMDAAEAVKYGNVSKVDIAVAEQKKRETSKTIEYTGETHRSPGLYVAIVLVVIVALCGGWYYWFASTGGTKAQTPTVSVVFKPIVPYTQASIISLDLNDPDVDPLSLAGAKLAAANLSVSSLLALVPVASATSTLPLPIAGTLSRTHIPDRLLRSLSDDYMIGAYSYDMQGAFVILKNTFFQNAFSGMLDWEKDLGSDFLPLIRVSYPGEGVGSLAASWTDSVVSNIDVRALQDTTGKTVLAYAFADKDTIVIATNLAELKHLLDEILQVRTVQ